MKKATLLLNFVLLSSSLAGLSTALYAQGSEATIESIPQSKVLTDTMERLARQEKGERTQLKSDHPFVAALASSYVTNPDLHAQYRQQYGVNEAVPIAKAGFRPSIALTSSGTRTMSRPDSSLALSDRSFSGGVTLNQSLLTGGSTIADVRRAEADVEAGFETVRKAEQDTLLSAVQVYLDLWLKRAIVELRKTNENVLQKTLERAEARAEVGELTLTDVSQTKASLAEATSQRIIAEQQAFAAEASYITVIGAEPGSLEPPPPLVEYMELPESLDEFMAIAQRNNPQVLNALANERSADNNIDVQKGSLLPSADLSAQATRRFDTQDTRANRAVLGPFDAANRGNSGTNGTQATVTFSIPLFQRGSEWARLRQTHQTAVQRKIQARSAVNTIRESTKSVWSNWNATKLRIPQLIIRVKAAEIGLQGARQESLVGERTLLDVLDTEKDLVEAQTNLVQAVRDHLFSGYQLLSVLGQLNAEKLALPVQKVDVKQHYERVKDTWIGLEGVDDNDKIEGVS
jgi:outer membrane protein